MNSLTVTFIVNVDEGFIYTKLLIALNSNTLYFRSYK